jgi:hypothetical protein
MYVITSTSYNRKKEKTLDNPIIVQKRPFHSKRIPRDDEYFCENFFLQNINLTMTP